MRKALDSKPARSTRLATITCLAIVICVSAVVPARAQKKPPILANDKISAFDTDAIDKLQREASQVENPAAAKLARNKLVAIGVEQIDTAFNDYRKKSRKNTDRLNFLFDFLEIGASSTISIIKGGLRAKSLIGEGLSLFQGSRAAFNRDFRFLEKQILFDKMVALRSQKLTAIYGKLNNEVTQYPWEQARSELRDYFFAGTIDEALSGISRETGAQAQTAEAALRVAKRNAGIQLAVTPGQIAAHKAFEALIDPIAASNAAQQKIINDENAKPAAQRVQATIDNAKAEQAKLLTKLKTIFDKVALNPILRPILPKISEPFSDPFKQELEASLARALAKTGSFDDYVLVLGSLRLLVVDLIPTNPTPNDEFRKLLEANQ